MPAREGGMSAINALVQRSSVHMMTDGLSYIDGVPFEVDVHKALELVPWRAALAATGPAKLGEFFAAEVVERFRSFDHLIAEGEVVLGQLFRAYADEYREGDAVSTLVLIGWLDGEDRPAAFAIEMATDGEKLKWVEQHSTTDSEVIRFKLAELAEIAMPPVSLAMLQAARYTFKDYEAMDPETELLHLLEIQRRIPFDDRYYVGGQALLTSIDRSGVHQRIVHKWDEDEPGKVIIPQPIEWAEWLSKRALKAAGIDLSGLSRLQRERMLKKVRKGTLR